MTHCGRMEPIAASVAVLLLATTLRAHAGWFWDADVDAQAAYDDNPTMQAEMPAETSLLRVVSRFPGVWRRPHGSLGLEPTIESYSYGNSGLSDSVNPSLRLHGDTNLGAVSFGGSLGYSRRSALLTEFDDTGNLLDNVDRINRSASLWSNKLVSSRASVQASALSQRIDFAGEDAGQFVAYDYSGLSFGSSINLSNTASLNVRLSGYRLDAMAADTQTDSLGLTVGIDKRLNSAWRFAAELGGVRNETVRDFTFFGVSLSDQTSDTRRTMNLSLAGALSDGNLRFTLGREQQPSSGGHLVTQDRLSLNWMRQLGPQTSVHTDFRGARQQALGGLDARAGRDYFVASATVERRVAPQTVLGLELRYRQQQRQSAEGVRGASALLFHAKFRTPRS
jgi:hypothetical protein